MQAGRLERGREESNVEIRLTDCVGAASKKLHENGTMSMQVF